MFANAVCRVLNTLYNTSVLGNDIMKMPNSSNGVPRRAISEINSNNVATIATVLATATREAAVATAPLVPGAACIVPTITTCTEAQHKANHLNLN